MKAERRERLKVQGQQHCQGLTCSYKNLMSPMGWSGAFHTKDRFLFRDLSEWVTVSPSSKQDSSLEPGGMKTNVPAVSSLDTLRAWSKKPMKSRLLLTVTARQNMGHEGICVAVLRWTFCDGISIGACEIKRKPCHKKKPKPQHPTTFALTICVGCAGYGVPDYRFVVWNCTGSWFESSSS